ncbi:MAG: HNH endonuclease [Paludibacteraceae bacterium]|nr:HNH endonuclease [Paludibacteraceae bacterium]
MKLSKEILTRLNAITDKRPSTVIQHIIKHGYITTEELANNYGYEHAPRAARDVRERGINLVTYRVKSSDGRNIAAYKFGDPIFVDNKISKVGGRTALSQALKKALIDKYGAICFVYLQPMEERLLQIDHRVPYEIGGEQTDNIDCYMLLSPSANRAKSWTCEHCPNWTIKDIEFCSNCFWAHPENYSHIAGREERQIVITFSDNEIDDYNHLISLVGKEKAEDKIKELIIEYIKK